MWSTLANSPSERQAFFSLLDQYFAQSPTPTPSHRTLPPAVSSRTPAPPVSPSPAHLQPIRTSSPSSLTPVPAPQSLNSRANTALTTHSTSLANSALQNTQLSSTALRNAGLSEKQAGIASKFGAKHSEVLAPHLAKAGMESAKSGWNNRATLGNAAAGAAGGKGPMKGPVTPSGLMSSKSIAG